MRSTLFKAGFFIVLLSINYEVFSQPESNLQDQIITKFISVDSLSKVQFLEDLLDTFPKKEYYIYYCYITRSGKGYLTTKSVWDNDINRYNPNCNSQSQLRRPIISELFHDREHPPKANQKFVFDRIFIRKFKDRNSSEPYSSLELYITD